MKISISLIRLITSFVTGVNIEKNKINANIGILN